MKLAYIALGSNIEPREIYLQKAVEFLDEHESIQVKRQSSIYETEPVGYVDQEKFLNKVMEIETSLDAAELLAYCQSTEINLGRKRELKWGPRTIDLDILLYNQENINSEQLIVPHPRMQERAFVLIPLQEIHPAINIPLLNKSVSTILDEVSPQEKEGVMKWMPSNGEEE